MTKQLVRRFMKWETLAVVVNDTVIRDGKSHKSCFQ